MVVRYADRWMVVKLGFASSKCDFIMRLVLCLGDDDDNDDWQHLGINININFKRNWLLSWDTRPDLTFR